MQPHEVPAEFQHLVPGPQGRIMDVWDKRAQDVKVTSIEDGWTVEYDVTEREDNVLVIQRTVKKVKADKRTYNGVSVVGTAWRDDAVVVSAINAARLIGELARWLVPEDAA